MRCFNHSYLTAGVVVVAVMLITTVLVSIVMLVCWQWHWLAVAPLTGFLFVMESILLSAVMYKVPLCFPASLQA
jgi:K+ transporter